MWLDYVRFWSPAPTSAAFHHKALHAVRDLLRDKVPRLKRDWECGQMAIHRLTKGFQISGGWHIGPFLAKNRLHRWHNIWIGLCKKLSDSSYFKASSDGFEDSEGIEIFHRFFEAYHASGVQDTAGKDPRIGMRRDAGFKKESIYNYHECQVRQFIFLSQAMQLS